MPASALAPVLRQGVKPVPAPAAPHDAIVPTKAFAADVHRKVDLRKVMGQRPDELEEEAPLITKAEKPDVNYRYASDRKQSCGQCTHFRSTGICEIVAGLIRRVDTCDRFEAAQEGFGKPVPAVVTEAYDAEEAHVGFTKLKSQLGQRKGVDDPGALAASIGRQKFGAKGMAKKAAAGRKASEQDWGADDLWDSGMFDTPSDGFTMGNTSDCPDDERDAAGRCPGDPEYNPGDGFDSWDSEVSPPGWSGTVKAMKVHPGISNPFALAWSMRNKGDRPHVAPEPGKAKTSERRGRNLFFPKPPQRARLAPA